MNITLKRFNLIATLITLLCLHIASISAQVVNIPDTIFKAYLVNEAQINTNSDGEIQVTEALLYTGQIAPSTSGISDFTGLEAFVAIRWLHCGGLISLSTLDVSANVALEVLTCNNSNLTEIIFGNNTSLAVVQCQENQLTALDISTLTALGNLNCSENQLTALDVSNNITLTNLSCNDNLLKELDIAANITLYSLDCFNNQLSILNTGANVALQHFYCYNNQLTTLDVSNCTALYALHCNENLLTTLDVSNNPGLYYFDCSLNQLTALDVSNNASLVTLTCTDNQISALDVATNTVLYRLRCSDNPVSSLDISTNTILGELYCSNCQLNNLNVQNGTNTIITNFDATSNPNLSCIQVDDSTYSATNWTQIDPSSFFSASCSLINGIFNVSREMQTLSAYPNPTLGKVHINLEKVNNYIIVEVRNLMGQLVFSKNYKSIQLIEIELNGPSGMYILHLQTIGGKSLLKVMKE